MSSSKKAIVINPEYFSLKKNRSMKKQPREKIPKNKTGKQQKKELLKRLKDIQDKKTPTTTTSEDNTLPTQDNLMSSIDFLNTLTTEVKSTPKTSATGMGTPAIETSTPATGMGTPAIETSTPATGMGTPAIETSTPAIETSTPIHLGDTIQKEPPYSNLKGSKKPSYREWLKQKSQSITIEKTPVNQDSTITQVVQNNLREEKLKKLQKKYKKHSKRHKTIKITETFGKRHGKVSIHIKNKEEKEKLEKEKKTLKKHTIPKIKAYLKEHNLLKIGSYAPNDVLREMYESAILSGNVNNNNKDILVHNFMET